MWNDASNHFSVSTMPSHNRDHALKPTARLSSSPLPDIQVLDGWDDAPMVDRIGFEPICCPVCQTGGHPKQPHSPNINERTSLQTLGIPLWSGAA